MGVDALIAQATARHESNVLAQTLAPLFPEGCPWAFVAAVLGKPAYRLRHQQSAVTAAVLDYSASLTVTAGQLTSGSMQLKPISVSELHPGHRLHCVG